MNVKRLMLLVTVMAGVLPGQTRIEPRSSFVVNFDYARFKNNDSTKYIEMYFACFPQLVTLESAGGQFQGFVEIRINLRNKQSGGVVVDSRSLIPVRIQDTTSAGYRNTLVGQMGYVVPTGMYTLYVTAIDSLAPTRRDSMVIDLEIPSTESSLSISDVELCSNIRQSTTTGDPFYKNAHEVVPNPTLLFGTANYPVIFHYLELYNLNQDETYTIKTVLADASGKPLQENSRKRRFGVENAVDVGTTNATKLPSGKYRFQVILLSAASEPLQRTEKVFFTYNPQSVQNVVSDAEMRETQLSGLTAEELAQEFDYARYHASQQEINTFSQITSAEGRRQFLAKFWGEVEMGKMGHAPVNRNEYLSRVRKANDRYRALSREGYRTDRGRVYLLYAEPDEIERRPSNEGGKPYEVWSYYQVENGVVFVFVDRTGFGDYVLVHSTKRGELRDDDWQRLLQ